MPVPDSSALTPRQRRAAAALLRGPALAVAGLARRFAAEGHELALVGGSVRDVFLGRRYGDLDLATDARRPQDPPDSRRPGKRRAHHPDHRTAPAGTSAPPRANATSPSSASTTSPPGAPLPGQAGRWPSTPGSGTSPGTSTPS